LIITTAGFSPAIHLVISIWAFIGGFIILADAWRLRAKLQEMIELQVVEEIPSVDSAQPTETTDE